MIGTNNSSPSMDGGGTGYTSGGGGDYLGAAIQVITGIANEAANRSAAKKENAKARDFAKSESELAYQRDQEMWRMQNEYNSPRAQMERLKEAGLNPNLVYGANAPGNQSGNAPSYTAAQGKFGLPKLNLPDMLSMYQNFQMRNAQIDAVKAGTERTQADTERVLQATEIDAYGLGVRKQSDPYQLDILRNRKEASAHEVTKVLQSIKNMSAQEANLAMDRLIKQGTIKQQKLDYELREQDKLSKENLNLYRKYGVNEGDNILYRILIKMLEASDLELF